HAFTVAATGAGRVPKSAQWPDTVAALPAGAVRALGFTAAAASGLALHFPAPRPRRAGGGGPEAQASAPGGPAPAPRATGGGGGRDGGGAGSRDSERGLRPVRSRRDGPDVHRVESARGARPGGLSRSGLARSSAAKPRAQDRSCARRFAAAPNRNRARPPARG